MELWRSHELSHWEMAEEYIEIKNLDIHQLSTTETVGEGDLKPRWGNEKVLPNTAFMQLQRVVPDHYYSPQSGLHFSYALDVIMISLLFPFFIDGTRVGICISFRVYYNAVCRRKGEWTKLKFGIAILDTPRNGKQSHTGQNIGIIAKCMNAQYWES